ncbi:NADP-dependent oxidoreductase domain-containing protein [Sporodiniella umbellata]|nr:NADP-dependent oxidoreductase domain-containing protein [Sporodiniella umbellata]
MSTREELESVIKEGILSGYRLIDSATVYRNEEALGAILKDVFADSTFGVQRKDVFITSKLSVHDSLEKFGLDYFDLYLIHWPGTSKTKLTDSINAENRLGSYRALEQLHKEGKLKQIGISNFTPKHMTEIIELCTIKPHVHQFELHPCLYQPEILEICKEHHIQVQAYSSLGEGKLVNGEIELDSLKDIAQKHNVSTAVVLLRWAVQHDWIVIPKSKTPVRVKENMEALNIYLSNEEMKLLDNAHKTESHRFCWDPYTVL